MERDGSMEFSHNAISSSIWEDKVPAKATSRRSCQTKVVYPRICNFATHLPGPFWQFMQPQSRQLFLLSSCPCSVSDLIQSAKKKRTALATVVAQSSSCCTVPQKWWLESVIPWKGLRSRSQRLALDPSSLFAFIGFEL